MKFAFRKLYLFLLVTSVLVLGGYAQDDPNPDSPTPSLLSSSDRTRVLAVNSRSWNGGIPTTGVSAFRYEIYQAPETWARAAYPHLVFYRAHDKGTHFAAWEQPQLLTEDMRETFRGVRRT